MPAFPVPCRTAGATSAGAGPAVAAAGPRVRNGLLLLALLLACLAGWPLPARAQPVHLLEVRDAIGPGSAEYIVRGIARASEAGAPLLVLTLDTPGGLDGAMREIIQAILASRVPVAVYVSPEGARAASAGTYVLYAAHVAAMAPATTLGAATPVPIGLGGRAPAAAPAPGASGAAGGSGAPGASDPSAAKQVHDAAAFIRGLAQQRGRNAQWAERAVREAVSLTAGEALQQNVVDVVAEDVPQLLARLHGRRVQVLGREVTLATAGADVLRVAPDWRQRWLSVIANPSLALVLMMVGIYGLMFEFASPGFGVAGTVGAICLLVALFALQLLPVNYAGLGLILLGFALLAAEVFTPTFGVLGVGGVVALGAGGVLLFDRDIPGFGVPLSLVVAMALVSSLVILAGGAMALRAQRRPVVSGREEMLGAVGVVLSLDPRGGAWAELRGERWRVRSSEPLVPGQRVRVLALDGLTLEVGSANPEGEA